MTRRLEDLEAHIANSVLLSSSKSDPSSPSPAEDLIAITVLAQHFVELQTHYDLVGTF